MSEENKEMGSAQTQESSQSQEQKEAYVPKKAYEEVAKDMHKFKAKLKEAEAKANEFAAQLKAQEEAKMQEQEQWKELYQKREAELEHIRQEASQERGRYMRSVKISALKQELGVSIKDEYLGFAPLDAIVVNEDGTIDKESVREVANSFKKEHGQLIPQSDNVNITGQAPGSAPVDQPVDTSRMSSRELINLYAKQKSERDNA